MMHCHCGTTRNSFIGNVFHDIFSDFVTQTPPYCVAARALSLSEETKRSKEKNHLTFEDTKPLRSHSDSSSGHVGKPASDKAAPLKASSKLAILKQMDEAQKNEKEPSTAATKEKPISPKVEQRTPAKTSPHKSGSSPEDSEKKRANYQKYRNFLNREGPKALGSKEVPKVNDKYMTGLCSLC
ncbi:hypothetical protein FKM82_020791 [Ascaphus truei]